MDPPHLFPLPQGERKKEEWEEFIAPHLFPLPQGERKKNVNLAENCEKGFSRKVRAAMAADDELKEEEKRLKYLRTIVGLTTNTLRQQKMSLGEARALIESAKKQVLKLFPDKEEAFELIYRPRFERILKENMEALGDGLWVEEEEEEEN